MANLFADRVKESTTTTGTGSVTLAGAASGFQTFNTAFGTSNPCYYVIELGTEWEVGIGSLSSSTVLARTTVLASSNGNALVSFSSGTKNVFCDAPAYWITRRPARVGSTTSSATPAINTDLVDYYELTAQAAAITSFTTNLTGTPTNNQKLWIAITGTAARAITWGASFEASNVTLPTTTVSVDRLDVFFVWNAATSKWRIMGVSSASTSYATLTGTETLTNKTLIASSNVVEEITTTTSSATPTPTGGSLRNFFTVTALAAGATFAAPSGTPVSGNTLIVRYKDNGTARTLAYNAIYRAIGVTLKTTTVVNKTGYFAAKYNAADSKWDILAVGEEA